MSIEPQRQKEQTPNQDAPAAPGPDRNDPAIEPQVADVEPETETGDGQKQGQPPAPSQSQSHSQSQNQSQSQQSNGSAYVPDYEPQEKKEDQRNQQPTQGTDADIDTNAG
ncbi:hypothetical protein ALQ33_02283 [Pseudomonas syringae pv. philadelphi]|uniref:Uncharacterized protein n=1 Tax=Pseudomonas syringae pv. philadelphi TaxID=251706 RepID=A0A3M3YVE5_9PSED|nr:hypothetical protein [Pseudomonas syringae group genomosp. 3]RMO85684.1 hypothetical protein ALQ33_02283 [Pseudomonas syringae pv. philadelphi]